LPYFTIMVDDNLVEVIVGKTVILEI
jgi:hypothetical protein